MSNPKKLDLFRPLLLFILFIFGLSILFIYFTNLSKQRAQKILQEYTQETKDYIEKNSQDKDTGNLISTLEGFNMQLEMCLSQSIEIYNCRSNVDFRGSIDYSLSHDLKDWSSTGFILKSNENTTFYLVGASGDLHNLYLDPEESTMFLELFSGEVSQIPWADYTHEYQGKEVVVPVKDKTGKIIGAIIRGVVEPKTF